MLSASCGLDGPALDLYKRKVWHQIFFGPERYTGVPRHVATTVRIRTVNKRSQQYIKLLVAYLTTLCVTQLLQRPVVEGW